MTKTITTCAGLGDTAWIMQKLVNQPDKFHWRIPGGEPRRGDQLFKMMPSLVESFDWVENLGYKTIKERGYMGQWKNVPKSFYLQANTHVEQGNRIEKFLPDLKTSYRLPLVTTIDNQCDAMKALNYGDVNKFKYIGIYTSAYETARHLGGWTAAEWSEFVRMLPPEYTIVFIGAPYDQGIVQQVMNQCNRPYIDTIGQPLPVVIEILKRLDVFIGFPSGLSILNELIGANKTLMFYSPKIKGIINAWADPDRIESGRYKGCLWCEPALIYSWMKENWRDVV